uniref:hypothetical protein n=1 Tax=Anaerococcus mediterraneensis TaxID=1870984 RepID=UPI000931BE78|nr:hypothetical protein [Anaerococcus mediterraneensis]
MKRIINGKRYDTDTAQFIKTYSSDLSISDFRYYDESLYLKKTGEFFLYATGNGSSKYASKYGDLRGPGEKIVPLTLDEAKAWVEKIEDPDLYEELFEVEEEGNIAFSLLLPENLYKKLDDKSMEDGITKKDIVVKALEDYLKY